MDYTHAISKINYFFDIYLIEPNRDCGIAKRDYGQRHNELDHQKECAVRLSQPFIRSPMFKTEFATIAVHSNQFLGEKHWQTQRDRQQADELQLHKDPLAGDVKAQGRTDHNDAQCVPMP